MDLALDEGVLGRIVDAYEIHTRVFAFGCGSS